MTSTSFRAFGRVALPFARPPILHPCQINCWRALARGTSHAVGRVPASTRIITTPPSSHLPTGLYHEPYGRSSLLQLLRSRILKATHRDTYPRFRQGGPGPSPSSFNALPPRTIIYGIMGVNALVFLGWQYAQSQRDVNKNTGPMIWMYNNFTSGRRNLSEGRVWTLLTSCFSHAEMWHIFVNGFTFWFMAPVVQGILGNKRFLAFYLGAGVLSSLISTTLQPQRYYWGGSHGASGAVYAINAFFACVMPRAQLMIFGVLPCPAWAFVGGVLLWEGYGVFKSDSTNTRTDQAGHLGGLLSGIGYFLLLRTMRGSKPF